MGSIAGLSATMLIVATVIMAIGAALQAAVGLGLALFVVPLLALIDTRLIPGPILFASVGLAAMMALRGRAAINRQDLTVSLIGLCIGTAIGAWGLSLVAPASLTKLFALLILAAVLVSLLGTGVRVGRGALLMGGGAAGIMGTMVGIHGPPIALVFQNAEPAQARAMLGAFFAVGYAMSVAALAVVGLFGRQELTLGLLLLPGVGIGCAIAPLAARFLDRRRLRIAILTISGASAVALLVR
jgi:uncharacterized membrane protein YfcA